MLRGKLPLLKLVSGAYCRALQLHGSSSATRVIQQYSCT